jgi:hypothetical protein
MPRGIALLNTIRVVFDALETGGLLLLQDKSFPSVVTLVTRGPVHGSWWAHPRSHEIFRCASAIAADPGVLVTKLLDGKVTFVHKRLWPAVLAVATAREPWQTAGLAPDPRALWRRVDKAGSLIASGKAAKEIECRLLVHAEQIHTEAGSHKSGLETWKAWARRTGAETTISAAEGRSRLEAAVTALGGRVSSLRWHRFQLRPDEPVTDKRDVLAVRRPRRNIDRPLSAK